MFSGSLAPHLVVDSLVAAVVEVVVDIYDVREGVVALGGVLHALVQAVSDHLRGDGQFHRAFQLILHNAMSYPSLG